MDKLNTEQLAEFVTAEEAYENAKVELAMNTAEMDILEKRRPAILHNFHNSYNRISSIQASLIDKYGKGIRVDKVTGDIIKG